MKLFTFTILTVATLIPVSLIALLLLHLIQP